MTDSAFMPDFVRQGSTRFWSWWSGELLALLPSRVRDRVLSSGQRLVVDFSGGKAHFLRSKGADLKRIGSIILDDPELTAAPLSRQVKAVRKLVDKAGLSNADGLVRLSREKVLRREVDLPAAAAA